MQKSSVIKRQPRLRAPLPRDTVKVPALPALPEPPNKPNILTFLPTIGMAVVTGGVYWGVSGTFSPLMIVPMLSMGLMTMGVQGWAYRRSQRQYEQQVEAAGREYDRKLKEVKKKIEALANEQFRIMNEEAPPFKDVAARLEKRHKTLWERLPNDNDFLDLRIGRGKLPISIKIELPQQEDDPRLIKAEQLKNDSAVVADLPIKANLNRLGSMLIRGSRSSESLYLTFGMLAHLAALHSPDEVHLYIFSHRPDAAEKWGWVRWLPHAGSLQVSSQQHGRISFHPETDEDILVDLSVEMRRRSDTHHSVKTSAFPHLVVVFDNTPELLGHPVMNMLLDYNPGEEEKNLLHASAIFVENPAPEQASLLVNVRGDKLDYRETWSADANQARVLGVPEYAEPKLLGKMARSMASLHTEVGQAAGNSLPGSVRLVELLNATQPHEVALPDFYCSQYDPQKVLKFPVGKNIDLKPQMIILREAGEGGYGAHAMLAGMTGQGKSVLLQAMVLSMAATNSPAHVNLVLADFKGGASELAKLQDLPHVVGFVTDLTPALVERFRIALESEILRRKTLFDSALETLGAPVANIRTYNKFAAKPLPHLVVVLDEFAHGLRINPNFRSAMDTIAAQGRALGVHLLLSTQKAADFDAKIRPNVEIRMSLRVASRDDSRIMFNRDEAFSRLTRPGQAYLQVGDNQIFEMFQAARADTPFQPDGTATINLLDDFTIYEVKPDGRRSQLYRHRPKGAQQPANANTLSEAEVLVKHIRDYCLEHYPPARIICLPPLLPADSLPLIPLLGQVATYQQWQVSQGWTEEKQPEYRLRVPMGMIDMPARQAQRPFILDLNQKDGNFLVVGPSGSGKSLFLRSLLMGLALTHSPAEFYLYIMGRGPSLAIFETLPHCGAFIRTFEKERTTRLFKFLEDIVFERMSLMRQAKADHMDGLRQTYRDKPLPSMVIVVEDLAGFKSEHEDKLDRLERLAREGKDVDIHLVLANATYNDIRGRIRANVGNRLALGLKSPGEYQDVLGKRAEVLGDIQGRGYTIVEQEILECQVAAPARVDGITSNQDILAEIGYIVEQMGNFWKEERPPGIQVLPKYVELEKLWQEHPVESDTLSLVTAPVGLDFDGLEPVSLDFTRLEPYTLVVGPKESGKTDFIITLCLAAAFNLTPEQIRFFVFAFNRQTHLRALYKLPHVEFIETGPQAKEVLQDLEKDFVVKNQEMAEQTAVRGRTPELSGFLPQRTVLIIDDFQLFARQNDLNPLMDKCLKAGGDLGINVILADTAPGIDMARSQNYNVNYIQSAWKYGGGIAFGADGKTLDVLRLSARLKSAFINEHKPKMGKGRGFLAYQGRDAVAQIGRLGTSSDDQEAYYQNIKHWVDTITTKYRGTTDPTLPE